MPKGPSSLVFFVNRVNCFEAIRICVAKKGLACGLGLSSDNINKHALVSFCPMRLLLVHQIRSNSKSVVNKLCR